MNPIVDAMIEKMSKKFVRISWLMLALVVMACIYADRRVNRWEHSLESMEKQCWRLPDQKDFQNALKIKNPSLDVPDSEAIVIKRLSLTFQHGAEAMTEKTEK